MSRSSLEWYAGQVLALAMAYTLAGLSVGSAAEPAGVFKYGGIHPLWPQMGGFCYIDVRHVHNKRPSDLRVFRERQDGEFVFVGDPVALGYDGPKYAYFGPHPLGRLGLAANENTYCYLRGSHFHPEKPEPLKPFVLKDGVYWFMGPFPPEFDRDRHLLWVNDSPGLTSYQPPKVTLANAPEGYRRPALVEAPPTPAVLPATGAHPGSQLGRKDAPNARPGRKR